MLMMQGADVLDALIEGVNIVELDPEDYCVGYGGVPTRKASCSSTPPACTARSGAPAASPRSKACAHRPGGPRGHEQDRPPPARRQGRADLRPQHGLQDRGRPQHAALAQALARVEAADRPVHYLTPKEREIASNDVRKDMAREGPLRGIADVRDDQLRRHQREGRDLRRHDDLRPLLQDPGPRRRLADPRGRPLRRRRRRRGGSTGRGEANLYNLSSFSSSTTCAGGWTRRTPGWRR